MALKKKALEALWALANYVLATTNMSARINQKATVAQRPKNRVVQLFAGGSSAVQWCSWVSFLLSGAQPTCELKDRSGPICDRGSNAGSSSGWLGFQWAVFISGKTHQCVSFDGPSNASSSCTPWSNLKLNLREQLKIVKGV